MHVVLDFDGTITVKDTIDQLAGFAVAFQEDKSATADGDWDARWTAIVQQYLADHREHKAAYEPAEDARTTLATELAFLRSLHGVDCASIYRLRDAKLFAGLTQDQLYAGGRQAVDAEGDADKVQLRRGFGDFLRKMGTHKWPVSIVSVNWSDAWIQGVLGRDDSIRVFANKVTPSGAIVPNFSRKDAPAGHDHDHDGNVPFASCSDKVEALEAAVADALQSRPDQSEAMVYMGDSTTDLECLVLAGAKRAAGGGGIAMANGDGPATSKLIQTLVRLGFAVPHVSDAQPFQRPRTADEGDAPRLAWARDYEEILASRVLD